MATSIIWTKSNLPFFLAVQNPWNFSRRSLPHTFHPKCQNVPTKRPPDKRSGGKALGGFLKGRPFGGYLEDVLPGRKSCIEGYSKVWQVARFANSAVNMCYQIHSNLRFFLVLVHMSSLSNTCANVPKYTRICFYVASVHALHMSKPVITFENKSPTF